MSKIVVKRGQPNKFFGVVRGAIRQPWELINRKFDNNSHHHWYIIKDIPVCRS